MLYCLTQAADKWLDELLPPLPPELAWANVETKDFSLVRVLRWLRFQIGQVNSDRAPGLPIKVHFHFGFTSIEFKQLVFRALELLLSIEAAQYSLASWPDLVSWLSEEKTDVDAHDLALFNLFNWSSQPTEAVYSSLQSVNVNASTGNVTDLVFGEGATTFQLSAKQPALYEIAPAATNRKAVAARLRAYYSPAAAASAPNIAGGIVAEIPLPVAVWAPEGFGRELTEAGLRAACSPGAAPLVWRLGRPNDATKNARRVLLQRSSVLLFFGRVPAPGSFNSSVCLTTQAVYSTTMRPRALRWAEVSIDVLTVQVPPAQAAWFGLAGARTLRYENQYFYRGQDIKAERVLDSLIAEYTAEQNQENEQRAGVDDADLLAPLPWNLLHWVRDEATADAVAKHKIQEYDRLWVAPKRKARLIGLVRQITALLAEIRPLWQQLDTLPTNRSAYVIVPIHIARPAYLPGFLPLTQDLRTKRLRQLKHLTFISLHELPRTAENPTWPVYVTTVEPRYWWALRQLPAQTELHWLLHEGLLHNSFCHALRCQYDDEREALYRQLLPLTELAPDPIASATALAADLIATEEAINLPAYTAPAQFRRVGAEPRLPNTLPNSSSLPTLGSRAQQQVPLTAEVADWAETTEAELLAASQVGEVAPDASWAELDETLLSSPAGLLTSEEQDQLAQLEEIEEATDALETEQQPVASGFKPDLVPAIVTRPAVAVVDQTQLVWLRRLENNKAIWHCQRLSQVSGDDFYFTESGLRKRLNRKAIIGTARTPSSNELPFWKQGLRDQVRSTIASRPEGLYNKMVMGKYGGIRLDLTYATFLRDYLAWDELLREFPSTTRLPGSYQNRAVVAKVIGGQRGELDEMQVLGWELATGRALSSEESRHLRLSLQQARAALLVWWLQRASRGHEIEMAETALKHELSLYASTNFALFAPAFNESGAKLGDKVSDYFLSILLESLQVQPI